MSKTILTVFVLLFSIQAYCSEDDIPLVGIDKAGSPIQIFVPKKDYQKKFSQLISSVNDSTMPVLEKRNLFQKWSLRTIVVGISVTLEAGFSPIFKLGLLPRFRILFSNSKDAVLP